MSEVIFFSLVTGVIAGVLAGFIAAYSDFSSVSPAMIGIFVGLITTFTSVALIRLKRRNHRE